ncbi:HesB-like protein [Bacteriovorax sp. BSW11_IV]|uniref:HesB/IscA family protein n=1 Tax=Bacteriovorax sp. BSW11_IV TaxID=1353529 RepID=UPI000389E5C7|nr:HesB-like protein [Bacteriovorax sp. BSW11_IV]EQC47773.1 HesB-like protein [Bacteriovorax sp. BSW11_IV]
MTQTHNKIQRDLVVPPTVSFTDRALQELTLIVENDFTLKGKYFRLLISGKKCEGFTYSAGFTDMEDEDFIIDVNGSDELQVIIDPFAAFYLANAQVDFVQNFEEGLEGFVITNKNQDLFKGKFWRADETKVPPLKKEI